MNHSRKKIFFAIFLSIVVFVGGSLSAFAKPPLKVSLYGVVYQSGENASWKAAQIMPVNNNTFGIYSSTTLELTTQIWFYFGLGTQNVNNFRIRLKKLSTGLQDLTSAGLGSYAMYLWDYNGSYTSGQVSIRTQVETERIINDDGTTEYVYSWHKRDDTLNSKSVFSFIIPFQNFMISENPFYFEVLEFSVNGEETVFTAYETNMLSAVEGINNALNDDSDLPIDTSDIPSAPDTSSINSGTQTGVSYINDFFDEFATGGAVGRVLLPISTYLTVADSFNDTSTGHRMITIIFKLGCGLVIVAFIINGIKRRGDFT